MYNEELCKCRGANGSITLYPDRMVVRHGGSTHLHEIALTQIRAIMVERKRVIPYATITVLAVAVAILAKYNPVYFVANLSDKDSTRVGVVALGVAIVCVIPVILRSAFVNVSVRSEGEPVLIKLGFVSARSAARMAKRFREVSFGG
jgi:hypothetical protein